MKLSNEIATFDSHPVADVFRSGYLEELKDYEFGQTTDYLKWSFYEIFKMKKELEEERNESIRQWKIYKSKYAYYDDDDEEREN